MGNGMALSSSCLPCRVVIALPPRALMENGGANVQADDRVQDGRDGASSAGWQIVQVPMTGPLDVASLRAVMQDGKGHVNYQTLQAMANESKHEITMNLYKK